MLFSALFPEISLIREVYQNSGGLDSSAVGTMTVGSVTVGTVTVGTVTVGQYAQQRFKENTNRIY